MKKRILSILAVLAVALSGLLAVASPAAANYNPNIPTCPSWDAWDHDPSWGQTRLCSTNNGIQFGFNAQVDDTQTDGYCVHLEWKHSGTWHVVGGSESCGAVVSTGFIPWYEESPAWTMRQVRGPAAVPPNCVGVNFDTVW